MRGQFRDGWAVNRGYRGGKKPPVPDPTQEQARTLSRMHAEKRTQVAIANELGVPRTRVRIWYRRRELAPLSRIDGHMIGRADARERASP